MRLRDVDFMRLLPQFMSDDRNAKAFAYAVQSQVAAVSRAIEHAQIYARIDSLSDEVLDELAWQFNIAEYRVDYNTSIKRKLVKECMALHYQRGTVAAVEAVVKNVFGTGSVEEWFEYGGEPYHFKVRTSNPNASDEMLADMERVIKETQNVRSCLEAAIVELMENMNLYYGFKLIIMDDVSLKTTGAD